MSYKCFEVEKNSGVAQIKMCRPEKANSMNADFWVELPQIITELDRAGDVRACILCAQGKNFSGGMDLDFFNRPEFASLDSATKREAIIDVVAGLQEVFDGLERARFPVIAAVQGACIGGALDMIAACDLRYACADARFCIEEINIGMMADLGSLQRLPFIMSQSAVREMAYTGQSLDGKQALELHLVGRVFADRDEMMQAAQKTALQIASKSPLAISATKKAFNYSRNHGLADSLAYAGILQAALLEPSDIRAAMKARMDKSTAQFADLGPLKPLVGATGIEPVTR